MPYIFPKPRVLVPSWMGVVLEARVVLRLCSLWFKEPDDLLEHLRYICLLNRWSSTDLTWEGIETFQRNIGQLYIVMEKLLHNWIIMWNGVYLLVVSDRAPIFFWPPSPQDKTWGKPWGIGN